MGVLAGILIAILATLGGVFALVRAARIGIRPGRCVACGYDVRGLGETGTCPECGRPFAPGEARTLTGSPVWVRLHAALLVPLLMSTSVAIEVASQHDQRNPATAGLLILLGMIPGVLGAMLAGLTAPPRLLAIVSLIIWLPALVLFPWAIRDEVRLGPSGGFFGPGFAYVVATIITGVVTSVTTLIVGIALHIRAKRRMREPKLSL